MTLSTRLLPGLSPTVAIIMVMAIANVIVIILVEWTLLLYMNHISFTTPTSAAFYVRACAEPLVVPIFGNVVLGQLSTRFAAGRVLGYSILVVTAGLVVIAFVRNSRPVFLLAFLAYSLAFSFRVLRLSMLADIVPRKYRTSILAAHQLCIPLGMVFGPVLWLIIQTWQGEFGLPLGVVADRFFANYALCAIIMFATFVLAMTRLTNLHEETETVAAEEHAAGEEDAAREEAILLEERVDGLDDRGDDGGSETLKYGAMEGARLAPIAQDDPQIVSLRYTDGSTKLVNLEWYKRKRFIFYALISLGVRLSTMIYAVAFQPILVDVFRVSERHLGQLYLLVAILALLPPVLVAVLSHVLTDRAIMLIALSLKTVGIALTLPLGGPVTEWRFVAGFILVVKGSMFFVPASLSLFTKVLGRMCNGALIGWLWSFASIGPAVVQVIMSDEIVGWFGEWTFAVFALPALAVFAMVLSPYGWAMVDPDSELTRLVVREVDHRERKRSKM